MSVSTIEIPLKTLIMHKNYTFTSVPVTVKSGNGAYYSSVSTLNIAVSGYTPIGVALVTWEGWAATAEPYIRTDDKLAFVSDISQTLTSVTVKITYIKNF